MLKFLVVDGFHTDKKLPIRLRLKLSRAVESPHRSWPRQDVIGYADE
jgi:hypothetical protein